MTRYDDDSQMAQTMRYALADEGVWERLVSTPEGLGEAEVWLKQAHQHIQITIGSRNAEFDALDADGTATDEDYRTYQRWRARALRFERLVQVRLREVKELRRRQREAFKHVNEHVNEEYRAAIVTLTKAISNSMCRELKPLLDEVHVPWDGEYLPLRILQAKLEHPRQPTP
jgi:hypothetical protein